MVTVITIIHVLVCLFLILVVLLQAGKGGGMGLAFGSSGAQTVFGGSGAGNLLTRVTAITAGLFMVTSLLLAYFSSARKTAWVDEYEQQMAAQTERDRQAREKLAAPVGNAGDAGAAAVEPIDQPEGAGATPTEGATAPAEGAAPAAPAGAETGATTTPPPAEGAAPAPATPPPPVAPTPAPAGAQPTPQ